VPANAASVSDAPGDSAASRPAMFTCVRGTGAARPAAA